MRILAIIVRTLMGLLFIFGACAYLFNLMPQPELTGNVKVFMDGMLATGYMMNLIKITELICGLAFVSGFFVPLAATVIAPIVINIFMFHLLVEPSGLPVAIFLLLGNLFLGCYYIDRFRPMLSPK